MPRKPILETINFDHVKQMASQGMSRGQIGAYFGITGQRVGQLIKENPDLEEAFESGLAVGINRASNKLMELIDAGNIVAILFFLKCQGKWMEQQYVKEKLDESTLPKVNIYIPHNSRDDLLVENNDVETEPNEPNNATAV